MKGLLDVKSAERKFKKYGWNPCQVVIDAGGILTVYQTEKNEATKVIETCLQVVHTRPVHLQSGSRARTILSLKVAEDTILMRGNSESEMKNWKMAIEEARKSAIVKVGNGGIVQRSTSMPRQTSMEKRKSLSSPTLIPTKNNEDDDGFSSVEFRRVRSRLSGGSFRSLRRVTSRNSITSRASVLSNRSGTSTPTSKRFPNIPLQDKQLALMHEGVNTNEEETKVELLDQTLTPKQDQTLSPKQRSSKFLRKSSKLVTSSLRRMSFSRAPDSSKRNNKLNCEDLSDKDTDTESTTILGNVEPCSRLPEPYSRLPEPYSRLWGNASPDEADSKDNSFIQGFVEIVSEETDKLNKSMERLEDEKLNPDIIPNESSDFKLLKPLPVDSPWPQKKLEEITQEDVKAIVSPLISTLKAAHKPQVPDPNNAAADSVSELQNKLRKWRQSADECKPVFSTNGFTGKNSPKLGFTRKKDMKMRLRESKELSTSKDSLMNWSLFVAPGNLHAPAVPEKPLKFQKLQLERLLCGEINPNPDKPVNRQHIKALLIPLNNALRKELSESADSAIYKQPKSLKHIF